MEGSFGAVPSAISGVSFDVDTGAVSWQGAGIKLYL